MPVVVEEGTRCFIRDASVGSANPALGAVEVAPPVALFIWISRRKWKALGKTYSPPIVL